MAKKYYDGDIKLTTDWGGDATTGNLPVIGSKVQKVIKDSINSKVGYVGRVDKAGQGFYVLSRDEATFNEYLKTITEDKPFGDTDMDGINGHFDAPFNYKMNITLINPESGYKSALSDSTGNIIKFTAETRDANDSPQGESLTITFKVTTEGGVETSYTAIYDAKKASEGIEYNLDGKLGIGQNTVVITAVGMNTGISAMRRITYRLIDMYFTDKFDIAKRYKFADNGTLALNIGYSLKGIGKSKIEWYFDGNLYRTTSIANNNPNLSNANETFYFTNTVDQWLTPGIHNIQMTMICTDTNSGEEFQTPIYYREFIIETSVPSLETPYILRKASFDSSHGILEAGETPTLYDVKQFDNLVIEFAAYYNGKSTCTVSTYITYPGQSPVEVTSEDLPLPNESFSEIKKQTVSIGEQGTAIITLKAYYGTDGIFETGYNVEVGASDMQINGVTDSIALSLNASGRTNDYKYKDVWEFTYLNEYGIEETITTDFSKNEYVLISTTDSNGNVIVPTDATEENTYVSDSIPSQEIEDFKYVKCGDEYYVWNREFDWSNTSGWHDNKLKLSNGNAITINYQPFSSDKLQSLKERGATYEFEFETTNVYNDDAVICRICGTNNFAPGITIYASGAELVVSREVDEPVYDEDGELININAGYIKAVSTKYKAEESNRISFVITPDDDSEDYRNRILSIYVNGELCGAYPYDRGTNFFNESKITFRGSEDACVNISSIQIYKRALNSNEILNNYIFYRINTNDKTNVYRRNDIMSDSNDEVFDSDKLKSQLPVMMIYQINPNQSLDDIHQEKKNKKLARFFDVVYIDIQNPDKNFLIKNAYITPQGTSSMNYPVKNLRLYTGKKNDAGEYYSRLFVGSNIFIDGSPNNLSWDNINLETEVGKKRLYSFRNATTSQKAAIPVNCFCLKADFAESSSSHNTGTARYWNNVLKSNGIITKAQAKAAKYSDLYPYDVRTCIDGFPITVFYQALGESSPRFEGKYNFNNDKSTESVFGFTGGEEIDDQEVKYFYIGKERPIIHSETDKTTGEIEYACSFQEGGYTETPTTDSPLYVSDDEGNWYMLRGKELFDNPKMECWELLNSVNEIALFKTAKGFGVGDDDEKVGIVDGDNFDEAFESRYPDCGDYYHTNSLHTFVKWLVSCRYLDIDSKTGESVPFTVAALPSENYYKNDEGKLSICSLSKQTDKITFEFPGVNLYKEIAYETIASKIKSEGYQQITINADDEGTLVFKEVSELPLVKDDEYEYLKCDGKYYTWLPSNLLVVDTLPSVHETAYDYVLVGETYYVWDSTVNMADYHETQWVDDTVYNRALKFAIEKYDHIDMEKMAAYYIYLMRFGGVDQTVKNSMLTTEGPAGDDPNSTLPSLWYFINYDNDTILGVKNDGRLVFDPYITRQTKDGTGYVYAGRESTLWNNLEADAQFMAKVTEVDNILAKGESDPLFALSYDNAIREYDINQSDKWCERIYNKDAERKYIQTYVEGWVQKIESDGSATHVFEDYLYDVQGSRSAHRKWWLGRRFNVFDSKFCNTNFMNSLIKFRSTNLPAGSSFTIKSGEPIFYAWGHDNAVTEMTPTAIQPGDSYTFTTKSAFNIGSYLEVMGSANISTFDLRNCVGALTEIDVTGCYSNLVGTKLKEILVGDNTRTDLVNISNTSLKFSGLNKATKLEVLDMTNIKNAVAFDGLNSLLNIREVYAKGTSVSNFTFADGSMIEKIELPATTETLSLTRSSLIDYSNISFEGSGFGKLTNLSINNCSKLMTNPGFILNWIVSVNEEQRQNLSLNLQGINWKFDMNNYSSLFLLENVGTAPNAQRNIGGVIEITERLSMNDVNRLKNIFGSDCFNEGSTVYIKAPTGLYINVPDIIWEGSSKVRYEITTVGTTLAGTLLVSATVDEQLIGTTNGIVTMDKSNLSRGYVEVDFQESDNNFEYFILTATYTDESGFEMMEVGSSMIKKRIYPTAISIATEKDSYNNKTPNALNIAYTPSTINDANLEGRGNFSVSWAMIGGSNDYQNKLVLLDTDKETAYIQAEQGFDGTATLEVVITRNYDSTELCRATKKLEFTNPDTIITKYSNEPVYNVLVSAGIIKEDETGFGKLTKLEAAQLTMDDIVQNGVSIFAGTNIKSFLEFQYFSNTFMGQMPKDGVTATVTPDGLFAKCVYLKEIAFSNNFKYTANSMFSGCTRLEYIYGPQTSSDEDGNPIYSSLAFEYVGKQFAYRCGALKQCMLSSTVSYIGAQAFGECTSLGEFRVPGGESLNIAYSTTTSPFEGCSKIYFVGTELTDTTSEAKYKVKDGACYGIEDDGTLTLVHLGKDTLISEIPNDKTVYATSYSMEYRTESNLNIPSNIIFNGSGILSHSKGTSVTLTQLLNSMTANGIFEYTEYSKYNFAPGETLIPSDCFRDVTYSGIANLSLPEGITTIGGNAFRDCRGLVNLTLPSTLTTLSSTAFWSATNLKNIYFNGTAVPTFDADAGSGTFRGVMLNNIYVKPECYQTFKDNINNLYKPYVKPIYAYSEGYLRIVKDGEIIYCDDTNVIQVGGIDVALGDNDYMTYVTNSNVPTVVTINGEEVGNVKDLYTTLYLGDNSSLYSGNGFDFTYGVYDENILAAMNASKWFYDKQFGGIRSNALQHGFNTTLQLTLDALYNNPFEIEYGIFTDDGNIVEFIDSSANVLISENESELNKKITVTIPDSTLNVKYTKKQITSTGLDGIVINKIGNPVFTDPFLQTASTFALNARETATNVITVTITSEQPVKNAVVTVTDGFAHTYRQIWNDEPLIFVVPKGFTFNVSATDFVSDNGKLFTLKEVAENIVEGNVELTYDTKTGMEINGNVLCYYTPYNDYFILLEKYTGKWSDNNILIEDIVSTEVLASDADGYVNTQKIIGADSGSAIFKTAYNCPKFGENIRGYIPSYMELLMLNTEISTINEYLITVGKEPIDFSNCWTSEMLDENHAWTSEGTYMKKDESLNYYIFGRRISI